MAKAPRKTARKIAGLSHLEGREVAVAASGEPQSATMRRLSDKEVKAFAGALAATAAPPPRPPRKQSSSAASSLASHVMRQPIDQKLWNSVRNDEQAFYALMIERQTLAASVLSNDETPGQA